MDDLFTTVFTAQNGKEAREVIVIEDSGNEPIQFSIFCKNPRPADEQTPGRKDAGATSKKPSDPLFQALRTMCMRQAPPTPLQPFTDVSQLREFMKEPSLILHHLPDCWDVRGAKVGCRLLRGSICCVCRNRGNS